MLHASWEATKVTSEENKKAPNLAGFKALSNALRQSNHICNPRKEQSNNKRTQEPKTLISPSFAAYEEMKHHWDEKNPNASATERDAALLQIVQACGV